MSDWVGVTATDGYRIPVFWRPCAAAARGSLLVLPALGTRAEFYAPFAAALARFSGQVLSIRFDGDALAPARAVAALNGKLAGADLREAVLTASDLGCRAGHFDWGRQPATVVDKIDQWLNLSPSGRAHDAVS